MRFYRLTGVLACVLGLAACASQQSVAGDQEKMLAAAGFMEKPADTPARRARLAALPAFKLMSQRVRAGGADTVGYVYADPQFCQCVFVGGPAAYSRFQQMAFEQHLAQERIAAQDMAEDDAFGWGEWGPYPYWGEGPVIVLHGGGGFHHG